MKTMTYQECLPERDLLFLVKQQRREKDRNHNDRSQGRNTAARKSGIQQHDRQREERGQFWHRPHQQHILTPCQELPPSPIRQRGNQADVEPGNGKDVSNAHPREAVTQLRSESAFIADNQRGEWPMAVPTGVHQRMHRPFAGWVQAEDAAKSRACWPVRSFRFSDHPTQRR